MVTNRQPQMQLNAIFGALADPTRRAIVARLVERGPASVGDLARPFRVSRPAISKHLRVLERAGIVSRTRDGRINRCRYDGTRMREASDWIASYRTFWQGQLDRFAEYLGSGQEAVSSGP